MTLEKKLLRQVGRAVQDFDLIRDGDRIAVGVSGGKDSLTLLDALLKLRQRAPISFEVLAFTVEQGKFLRPIEPLAAHMKARGVAWTYYRDEPSFHLLEEQPQHGCDLCSRYRRRAVYEIAAGLGANVVALGHTANDFCEALLRNALYTGKMSALPPVTQSRSGEYRLIRPLVYVNEELTQAWVDEVGVEVTPCVCSHRTGTVRRSIRQFLDEARQENPHVLDNLLSAMGNLETSRLLDRRYYSSETESREEPLVGENPFPVLTAEAG